MSSNSFEKQIHRNQFLFYVPENISHFLWLYQTSQFISCNQKLAGIMEEKYQLYQNDKQFDLAIWPLRYIVMSLNKMEKHYWLAGGTLLGRENSPFFFEKKKIFRSNFI